MKKVFKKWSWAISVVVALVFITRLLLLIPQVYANNDDAPEIIRYEGYSRENVAEMVASAHFSNSNKVIIVNREKFSDAISATNISRGKYPVLYTHMKEVFQTVR